MACASLAFVVGQDLDDGDSYVRGEWSSISAGEHGTQECDTCLFDPTFRIGVDSHIRRHPVDEMEAAFRGLPSQTPPATSD